MNEECPRYKCREAIFRLQRGCPDSGADLAWFEDEVEALPPDIDREQVYALTARAVHERLAYEMFPTPWTKRRDEALDALGRALSRLERVLEAAPFDHDGRAKAAFAGVLRREFDRISEPDEEGRLNYMQLDREVLNLQPGAGRPKAIWRETAEAGFRALGIVETKRKDLQRAAGLFGRTPTSQKRRRSH